jgi:4-aminobutyrate aminotransferase/(S)-3-amino-2-methylpropionate transaminase
MIVLQAFLDTVEKDSLLENTIITGQYLLNGLEEMIEIYPHVFCNARGSGTYCAIDLFSSKERNELILLLRNNGVEASGCGDVSIRLRPSLIFQPKHVNEFLNILEYCIQQQQQQQQQQ